MSYSNVLDDLKKLSHNHLPNRVPIFPIPAGGFCEKVAGVTYRQNRTDLKKMVHTSCIGAEKFDYDWAWVFPDDFVEWEPFGVETLDNENLPIAAIKYLPATFETLSSMVFPNFSQGRMPLHLETIRRVKNKLGNLTAVTGRIAAPFSTLALLFGVEPLMLGIYDNPKFFKEAMAKLSDFIISWGIAQRNAGADILWVGDCLAGSAFISSGVFAEFVIPYAEKVIRELKKTEVFLIYHACETSLAHIKLEAELSVDAVNIGDGIEIMEVKKQIKNNKCLTGNFNPIYLRDSTPDKICRETARMIENNKIEGGYIFSTSEGITNDTAEENVAAMMETARKYVAYS